MIYVFLADGFEDVEAIGTIDVLKRCGLSVQTVGIGSKTVTSSHGLTVCADITEDGVAFEKADAVVLPGGMPGTVNLENNETVQKITDYCAENGKYLCAICAAPSIFGHKGLLDGVKATAFPEFQSQLTGAVLSDEYVVTDGKFITARGAGVSLKFGAAIASVFVGKEKADRVLCQMQCE